MKSLSVRKFMEVIEIRSWIFKRLQSHRYFPVIAIASVVLLAACVHVWQRVVVYRLVHDVAVLRNENQDLVDSAKKLRSEISALAMSTRIERFASDSLGLKAVEGDRLFTLVRGSEDDVECDELTTMVSSIKRIAQYLPVITESQATAREIEEIR
ncbi:MAG: cell division protein FtsL, partial [candidate division Zixibacteria bacterium]|nr:cell division protein FtsL [candidate division Zixibacteria bacterium]